MQTQTLSQKQKKEIKQSKTCNICKMPILNIEDYCVLEQFKEGESKGIAYYQLYQL